MDHGLKPDLLMGTSGGAIAAVLYASGVEPIVALKMLEDFTFLKLTSLNIRSGGMIKGEVYKQPLEDLLPYKNLEDLPIPTYINAVDILKPEEIIFKEGNIADAILASAAFPMVFAPIKHGDKLLGDGGIINNFAANAIREECEELIGLYVNRVETVDASSIRSPISGIIRSMNITVAVKDEKYFHLCDLIIEPEMEKYNLFDKGKLREIFEVGYEEAIENMEDIVAVFDRVS